MILSTGSGLQFVFTVFAVFWVVVMVVLYVAVGVLLKRHDRLLQKHDSTGSTGAH